ncbi:Uncharacterised protein [Bordetella bronchiseptica]|nr:Uncharacterised protein [Bordetella bronchiseptica]
MAVQLGARPLPLKLCVLTLTVLRKGDGHGTAIRNQGRIRPAEILCRVHERQPDRLPGEDGSAINHRRLIPSISIRRAASSSRFHCSNVNRERSCSVRRRSSWAELSRKHRCQHRKMAAAIARQLTLRMLRPLLPCCFELRPDTLKIRWAEVLSFHNTFSRNLDCYASMGRDLTGSGRPSTDIRSMSANGFRKLGKPAAPLREIGREIHESNLAKRESYVNSVTRISRVRVLLSNALHERHR